MRKKFLGKEWFFEDFLPGELQKSGWGFLIEKEIFSGKSKFQKIEIFENEEYGRILVLDGQIQLSTKFEYIYHEMLVHPAMLCHQNPQNVLIIGGGDGGALREVAKHPVKEIYLVDIDQKVIEVSKKYLPSVSAGSFKDKRLKTFHEDGRKFIKKYKNYFDVIISDCTDYFGPAKKLGEIKFLKDVSLALRKNGIFMTQSGYLKERFGKKVRRNIKKVFPFFQVHKAFIGCFPFDEHTFSLGSKEIDFRKIEKEEIERKYQKLKLKTKYYSPEIHFSSLFFPKFLKNF
jgi:spermidine synthase